MLASAAKKRPNVTKTMPNFLVIGAAKSGTDALCNYLGQHPEIYMSANKEPMFFVAEGQNEIPYRGPGDRKALKEWDSWITTLEQYQALFVDASTERAIGEGSTWYLYDEQAHRRIRHHVPRAKLIAILRNPVDRAYSAFTMLIRDGRETTLDFSRALAEEDERVRANWEPIWHYRRMGLYYTQLKRYFDTFDAAQIYVVLYDEFSARPLDVMQELFRFLEVDDQFEPDVSARLNVSLVPRNPAYHWLIARQNPLKAAFKAVLPPDLRQRAKARLLAPNLTKPAPLAPEVRRQLIDIFRPEILRLQDLLGRDLSPWLR